MNPVIWMVAGAITGCVFTMAANAKFRAKLSSYILFGVAGALCAGWLISPLLGIAPAQDDSLSLQALLTALVGAVIFPIAIHVVHRSKSS